MQILVAETDLVCCMCEQTIPKGSTYRKCRRQSKLVNLETLRPFVFYRVKCRNPNQCFRNMVAQMKKEREAKTQNTMSDPYQTIYGGPGDTHYPSP